MPSYLITGSSRGLGLAMVTKLLEDPKSLVIATARNTAGSQGLQQLAKKYNDHQPHRLIFIDLDVTDEKSVANAAAKAAEYLPDGLDHLISSAGISLNPLVTFDDLDIDETLYEINFNIKATILVLRAFLPLVKKSQIKKISVMSSAMGSLTTSYFLPNLCNAYSTAKAALNMLVRKWAAVLKDDGITTILVHPGFVGATEMGSVIGSHMAKNAPNTPNVPEDKSAAGCLEVLHKVTLDDNAKFFRWDGENVPW